MRNLLLALVLAVLVPVEAAEVSPYDEVAFQDPQTGFRFMQMMATYRFQRKLDYGSPQLGWGVAYVENTGATATITVYDLGQQGIPDGINDSRVREEFRTIDESIMRLVQKGEYKSAKRIARLQPLNKDWLQDNHEILLPGGKTVNSYSFIRGRNGKFVKVRVTGAPEGTYARLPPFMIGVGHAIGTMIPGYRPPAVAP
jgi:hypothetical protein